MCHFLMPRQREDTSGSDDGRYGQDSVIILANHLRKEGGAPSQCEVKLLGGAAMFGAGKISIGEMNIRCAEECLAAQGFIIKARHVGGSASRHIIFELETGDVWVRTNSGLIINESKFDPPQAQLPDDHCSRIVFGGVHG
jgi:chemotaxis protein CheD